MRDRGIRARCVRSRRAAARRIRRRARPAARQWPATPAQAAASRRSSSHGVFLRLLNVGVCVWRFDVHDVVGAHPGRRANGQPGLGACRKLARGLDVAAAQRRPAPRRGRHWRGRPCGHRPWRAARRRPALRVRAEIAVRSRPTASSASFGLLVAISACASRISINGVPCESCAALAQRRDRFGRLAALEQRLALELVEIRIVRLRPGSARRSARWPGAGRRAGRSRWRAHNAPAGCGRSSG